MTKTILGTVAAAAIAIAAIAAPAKAKASVLDKIFGPKAVDFTFSLECRALESNWNQTIHLPEYDAVSKDLPIEILESDAVRRSAERDRSGGL